MITIVLLGTGNVATHLFNAFQKTESVTVVQVYNRTKKGLLPFKNKTKTTLSFSDLIVADVYIIAIPDDVIVGLSEKIFFKNRLVVHTSGSIAIDKLSSFNRKGVFYPLQSFTKNKTICFKNIPICIEAEQQKDEQTLQLLAKSISEKIHFINSKQRKAVHIAAIFVNNFVNHLYLKATEICNKHQVSFDILKPLILETSQKIVHLSAKESQTGPAKRNDQKVIDTHINYLQDKTQQEIYKLLTQSIQNTYDDKL